MANNASRRARERRLRARYRRKIFFTAVLWLLIGAVAVYALLSLDILPAWDELTGIALPTQQGEVSPTPSPMVSQEPSMPADEPTGLSLSMSLEATPLPMQSGELALEQADEAPAVVTAIPAVVLTEEPTEVPTAVPTEVPTAVPTEVPTAVPTEVPTAVPTMAPIEAPAATEQAEAQQSGVLGMLAGLLGEAAVQSDEQPEVQPDAPASAAPTVAIITAEPTAEPTVEPTVEPTAVPEPEPIIVPYGEAYTFDAQITDEGDARDSVDVEPYETLNLTLAVDAYKDPAYFEANYAQDYNLQGNEAAVEFDLTLNGYTGTTEIIPQNFLLITFINKDESETAQGFQLMDKEIAGNTEIAVTSEATSTLYKRYPYNADQGEMEYMVVTAYNEGVKNVYWFEIHDPNPEPTATPEPIGLSVGSSGDDVKRLQQKLIELGLLQGSPDGKYGNYTAEAVKILQGRYGMEQTGIADEAFLKKVLG